MVTSGETLKAEHVYLERISYFHSERSEESTLTTVADWILPQSWVADRQTAGAALLLCVVTSWGDAESGVRLL